MVLLMNLYSITITDPISSRRVAVVAATIGEAVDQAASYYTGDITDVHKVG